MFPLAKQIGPLTSAGTIWDPSKATNAYEWFRASSITGISNNATFQTWTGSIASAAASQSTSGLRPLYIASAVNGLPGVDFAGSRILSNTSLASLFTGATPNLTIYQVLSSFALAQNALGVSWGATKASAGISEWFSFQFMGQTSGTQVRVDAEISGNAVTKQAFPLLNNTTYHTAAHVYCTKWSTSGSTVTGTIYVDGTQIATASTPSGYTGATTIDTMTLGGWILRGTAARFHTGKLCEHLICNQAHSDAERNQVENWFKSLYGI